MHPVLQRLVDELTSSDFRDTRGARIVADLPIADEWINELLAALDEWPKASGIGVDASDDALDYARRNAARLGMERRAEFRLGDWAEGIEERFDLILCNPPYVADADPHLGLGDLRFEPAAALRGGPDGLAAIRQIVAQAPAYLRPNGWLLFEHGYDQAHACQRLLAAAGFVAVTTARDLAELARVSGGRRAH